MKSARPYQQEAFDAIRDAYRRGLRRVLIELATGLGKTVIFVLITMMVKTKGGRVLILVNRDVLVTQALEELKENGVFAEREQAEDRAKLTSDVVVGSIQSMQGKWLQRWPRDYFKMVITDEVHGSAASTFRKTLDHFENAYHLGVTATAERHDKKGLWQGFQEIVYSVSLHEGIKAGWLCGFEFVELDCPVTVDLKLAKKAAIGENEEVFDSQKYLPRLAECALAESKGHKGLFFLPNCRVSNGFVEILRGLGMNARHVDSSYMTPTQTKETLEWFYGEKEAILCNSDLLSVGFNHPPIDLIGLFRPIASTPMYKQRLGRGTRPLARVDDYSTAEERLAAIAASTKPHCKVINAFFENAGHDLASPSCLITDDAAEREALDNARSPGQRVDLAALENQLKAKRMADQAEEERKFAEKVANSQAKKKRKGVYVEDILRYRNPGHQIASDKFVRYVRSLGVEIPKGTYSSYQMMRIKERITKQTTA